MANDDLHKTVVVLAASLAASMKTVSEAMSAAEAGKAALKSRVEGLDTATVKLMEESLAMHDLIDSHASNTAALLDGMAAMQQDMALIKESLVALASTRH